MCQDHVMTCTTFEFQVFVLRICHMLYLYSYIQYIHVTVDYNSSFFCWTYNIYYVLYSFGLSSINSCI